MVMSPQVRDLFDRGAAVGEERLAPRRLLGLADGLRGLDALRRAGWHGRGPIPADHIPNQGFLRSLLALAEAAEAIGESEEATRCETFLADSGTSVEEVANLR